MATWVWAADAPASGPTGLQVMERVNARPRPAASARRMLLVLQREGGRRIDREIIAYQTDDGARTKTLYTVVSPADMLGLSILRWEEPGDETQWLTIEGLPQPARAAIIDPSLPFWATEFTLGDIRERFPLDAYEFRVRREATWQQRRCWVVEARVIDKRLGYSQVVGWIDQERGLVLKAKYRDQHGRLLKGFWADRIKNVDGFWTPHRLTMHNARTRTTTAFEIIAATAIAPPPADLFAPSSMNAGLGRCYPAPCGAR